jgi:hypothetical protein
VCPLVDPKLIVAATAGGEQPFVGCYGMA